MRLVIFELMSVRIAGILLFTADCVTYLVGCFLNKAS